MGTQKSNFNITNLNYWGLQGLSVTDWGQITTNAIGISTSTVRWKILPMQSFARLQPPMWSAHPLGEFMLLTHRNTSFKDGMAFVDATYEGFDSTYTPVPIYELAISCGEEPIETNPRFTDHIAGTPSDPINGSIWTSIRVPPGPPAFEEQPAPDPDSYYVFSKFAPVDSDGNLNPKAGITKYLSPDQVTWRQITVRLSGDNTPYADIGTINQPPGPVPTFNGVDNPRNWLYMGCNQIQRGNCFEITHEWKLSGPYGWDGDIYASS